MCGLAGFLGFPVPVADVPALLNRMASTLTHRGPDDQGIWIEATAGVGLAHRRLSIQDLSPLGAQPMHSASRRFVMAYNGEVYNFPDLRSELTTRGHSFRGGSDTEVMLAAFEEWGLRDAVPRFIGMFAFAVWDAREQCLWLCRDRIGVKPLYVGHVGDSLVFGSELKSVRCIPGFDRTVDRDALALFMRHDYVPGPYSIYASMGKLPPGVLAKFEPRAGRRPAEVRYTYWSVEQALRAPVDTPDDDDAAIAQLEQLLRDSIRRRMIADVPLGVLLSGGIDSSLVTALAQSVSAMPLKTFTIGFTEQGFDETAAAAAVARHLGTDHTSLYVSPADALTLVPDLAGIYDEPFGDSSQIPTTLVSRMARQKVTVALSGDGGDELFYGYSRYPSAEAVWRHLSPLPLFARRLGAAALKTMPPKLIDVMFERLSTGFGRYGARGNPSQRLRRLAQIAREPDWYHFYRGIVSRWTDEDHVVRQGSAGHHFLADPPAWMRQLPPSAYMMVADIQSYLCDDILTKADRASMSTGLELREPMLDHRIVEFALSMPFNRKFRDGRTKWILRQIASRHLPPALLERPKQGFEMPVGVWLRGPLREWAESLLDERRLSTDGYLDSARIRQCWKEHLGGRLDAQAKLWNVLMFQSWLDCARAETRARTGAGAVAASALPVMVTSAAPAARAARRPCRVLHAIHSISGGGAETQLRMLLDSWPYPDVETGVFYVAGDRSAITNAAVRLFPSRQRSTRHLDYLRSMLEAIETFDPDVIQIWLPESVAIPAMLIGRLQRRKTILSYRGRRTLERPLTYVEVGLGFLCVDSIVSNHEVLTAPSYAGSVFRWLFERKRGLVIRNGIAVDTSKLVPAAVVEHRPVVRFVCVGRLTPLKNYPLLVEALRLLADRQEWSLDIWGEGEARPEVEQAIANSGLGHRILLRGYSDAVPAEMLRASALILPSLSEGMPNVLIEAMALGLPVIAADIEGVREVVGNEQACVWIDPLDPHDIARKISSVLDGEVDLPGLAARGRLIADRYSITDAQAVYHKLYRDLLHAC